MRLLTSLVGICSVAAGTSFANPDAIDTNTNTQNNPEKQDLILEYFEAELDETENTDDENNPSRFAQATEGEAATVTPPDGPAPAEPAATNDTATKPKKVVKKKKKKGAATDGAAAIEGAVTGHGLQETGLPYKANVDLSLDYSSKSRTKKYTNNSFKDSQSSITLDLSYLFVFGRMEAGPKLTFTNSTTKSDQASGDGKVTATVKESGLGFGAAFAFNLGNIHQDKTVPYVGVDFMRTSTTDTSTTEGTSGSIKDTITEMGLGLEGGVKYFMGAHVALKPFFNYTIVMSGENKSESTGTDALVASVTGSNLSLGLGLVQYF